MALHSKVLPMLTQLLSTVQPVMVAEAQPFCLTAKRFRLTKRKVRFGAFKKSRDMPWTSNIFDDYRTQRLEAQRQFQIAEQQYKLERLKIKQQWLHEINLERYRQQRLQRSRLKAEQEAEAKRLQEEQQQQEAQRVKDELRKAEMDYVLAQVRLQRALRMRELDKQKEQAIELRRQRLLEMSRNWITPEDLVARIEHALDNPKPFGFTHLLPRTPLIEELQQQRKEMQLEAAASGEPLPPKKVVVMRKRRIKGFRR